MNNCDLIHTTIDAQGNYRMNFRLTFARVHLVIAFNNHQIDTRMDLCSPCFKERLDRIVSVLYFTSEEEAPI